MEIVAGIKDRRRRSENGVRFCQPYTGAVTAETSSPVPLAGASWASHRIASRGTVGGKRAR